MITCVRAPDSHEMYRMLNNFLPEYRFHEAHASGVKAPLDVVFRAVKQVTPREIPLFRVLFALRALPAILTRKTGIPFGGRQPLLEQMLAGGFVLLSEEPDREIVLGSVGQFWKPFGRPLALATSEEFLAFERPGYAKAAMSISVENDATGRQVTVKTETRVHVPDPAARRKFAAYWLLIKPGSGLIRRMWLRAIKRRAERGRGA